VTWINLGCCGVTEWVQRHVIAMVVREVDAEEVVVLVLVIVVMVVVVIVAEIVVVVKDAPEVVVMLIAVMVLWWCGDCISDVGGLFTR